MTTIPPPSWRTPLLTALHERDKREKSQLEIFSAYTKLAARTSFLESNVTTEPRPLPLSPDKHQHPLHLSHRSLSQPALRQSLSSPASSPSPSTPLLPSAPTPTPTPTTTTTTLHQLRHDLSTANTQRTHLQTTLSTLQSQHADLLTKHQHTILDLQTTKTALSKLETRLKSREEELLLKNKQIERLSDDLLVSDLHYTVLKEQKEKLEAEYKDVVERLVKEKERVAEEIWKFTGGKKS